MKKQRIGLIGWLYYYNNDYGKTVAACDTNLNKIKDFQSQHTDVNIYTDYKEMVEKEGLDGVIISTPNWLHKEMAIYFLEKGIHVFLEKPMGINKKEIDEILLAQKKTGKTCAVDFEMRVSFEHLRTKEILASGEIGEPAGVEFTHHRGGWVAEGKGVWRTNPALSGGLTLMEGCHRIDVIRSLFGDITHVQSFSLPNVLPHYNYGNMRDNETIHLWFENGMRGTLIHSHTSSVLEAEIKDYGKLGHDMEFIITGTEGCIKVDYIKQTILICSYEDFHPDAKVGKKIEFKRFEDYSFLSSAAFGHDIQKNHLEFIKSCATGTPFHQDTYDAWKTHVVCIAAEKSCDEDFSKIELDYTPPA